MGMSYFGTRKRCDFMIDLDNLLLNFWPFLIENDQELAHGIEGTGRNKPEMSYPVP